MNASNGSPALFDTYNARFLDPRTIARSFIVPQSVFALLCKNENSLVIGPRGSGKTTLMKMLRPSALRAWKHESKVQYLKSISFSAVYVASDSGWNSRLALIKPDHPEFKIFEILQNATFVTYLMASMLDAVSEAASIDDKDDEELQKFRIRLNNNQEGQLSFELAKRWQLDLEFSSFRAMRFALEDRISLIDHIYFQIATLEKKIELSQLQDYRFLSIDLVAAIKSFVTTVNELCEIPERVWAFCFDEVEILHPTFELSLLRSLRSTKDQKIRFKISASPFSRTQFAEADSTVPMGGHDFTPITLTYARKHEGVRFSRHMLEALLNEAGLKASPSSLFGSSKFEPSRPQEGGDQKRPYAKGGERYSDLKELERDDPAFAAYLERRNINLEDVDGKSEDARAEIRKLIQIAEIRREFGATNILQTPGGSIARYRSRKRIGDLYTGAESILTICDGNPRWLIGLMRPLIDEAKRRHRVSRSAQARSISTAIARFLSLLTTIPFPESPQRQLPITKIIDEIGSFFFADITNREFKTEPYLSFFVDDRLSENEVNAIGAALNQGAFVFIPSQETEHCTGDIRNKRFRVSYLLCPRYKLPLMYGQSAPLSRILHRKSSGSSSQYTLSDLYEPIHIE
jgi:energy-coupling factor transporter ATP-binding protein EcfA2